MVNQQTFRQLVARAIESWARRNMWKVFGYPYHVSLDEYWKRYRRDGIGSRIIRAYPDACWRAAPVVQDDQGASANEGKDYSAFTAAWEELNDEFHIISYLRRVDRLSRVGHYAILVMGFEGETNMARPAGSTARLLYLAPYSERAAKISSWETDPSSPRYGLPLTYRVHPSREQGAGQGAARGNTGAFTVHWTRVIHVAENLDEDEVFGEPALRPVWNNLLDLEKIVGSGAETFWLNARGGLSVEAHPDARLGEATIADMKQQLEDYSNELRRNVAMAGAKVSAIQTTVADPKPNAEVQLQIIGGTTGIPQRILLGTERGELASTQDATSWEGRVDERVNDHCNPNIMRPFVERMIATGNLPEPKGKWRAEWAASNTLSDLQRAELAKTKIEAATAWANGMADRAVSLEEFRPMIDLDPQSEYELEDGEDDTDDADDLGDDLPPPDDADDDDAAGG